MKNIIKNIIKNTIDSILFSLDSVMVQFKFKNVFLKLDTQGFDLEAFTGVLAEVDKIKGVQTEVSFTQLYKNAPTFDKSLKLFKENGFEVSGMYSLGEYRFPHALEHDCIYLPKLSADDKRR